MNQELIRIVDGIARDKNIEREQIYTEDLDLRRDLFTLNFPNRTRDMAQAYADAAADAKRLGFDNVKSGAAQMTSPQRREDGRFLYDVSSRGIDQEGARLHPCDFIRADHPARFIGNWCVQ